VHPCHTRACPRAGGVRIGAGTCAGSRQWWRGGRREHGVRPLWEGVNVIHLHTEVRHTSTSDARGLRLAQPPLVRLARTAVAWLDARARRG
jgi:hypothetical protein